MSAVETKNPNVVFQSMTIKPPSHPTYDLNGVIKLALAEDAGDQGFFISFLICIFSLPTKYIFYYIFVAELNT